MSETVHAQLAYLVTIDGEAMIEVQLRKRKATATKILTIAVNDDLVDMVATHTDPALAWAALKTSFSAGDQNQILMLMGHLQTIRLSKRGSVEDYNKKARELNNRLASMGKTVSDKALTQLVLNGLPRSFESTIQMLTHQTATLSFDQISSSLTSEPHRRVQRATQIGAEDALCA